MMKEQIIFDDWIYRPEISVKQRKRDYYLCFILIWILAFVSIIGMCFSLYAIFPFVLAIFVNIALLFEYLKVKNNHLIITQEAIYVTNRFNITKKYLLSYKECSLEIKRSVKRGGGIWLKFYDKNGTLFLKYEDMLNSPAMYSGKLLPWGEAIKSLQIPIIDKNDLYNLW